ncbi:hypothetical protein Pelo_17397 [Pelomyxa schiedti]|nr:hypothetical protein Pelo_17397 [Pelomyxa schiedti]
MNRCDQGQSSSTKQQSVAFLTGWHNRAGCVSAMTSLNVPQSVGRFIVEFLIGFIGRYHRGTWRTIGRGITVNGDTVEWMDVSEGDFGVCGSSVDGRLAWMEPSIQEISGSYLKVYWAFDVVKYTEGSCQEGLGASTSLFGMELDANASGGGDFYPITFPSLSKRGVKSFGLSLPLSEPRVQGSKVTGLRLADTTPVTESDRFSFMVTFESPDKHWARVEVMKNNKQLVVYEHVDTSEPMFPTVNMCCSPNTYRFVMDPPLPPLGLL